MMMQQEDILSAVKPYFSYARELKQVAPLIAYRCEYYGTKVGIKLCQSKRDSAKGINLAISNKFLMHKLDELKKIREELIPKDLTKEQVSEQQEMQVKNFVMAVFHKCIKVEMELHKSLTRAKSPLTFQQLMPQFVDLARDFYRCHHFIYLLSEDMPGEKLSEFWEEKTKFCKYKAAQGLQSLQRGFIQPLGNPFDQQKTDKSMADKIKKMKDLPDQSQQKSYDFLKKNPDQHATGTIIANPLAYGDMKAPEGRRNTSYAITQPLSFNKNQQKPSQNIQRQDSVKSNFAQSQQLPQTMCQSYSIQASGAQPTGDLAKDKIAAQQLIQDATSELEFKNVNAAHQMIQQAMKLLQPHKKK